MSGSARHPPPLVRWSQDPPQAAGTGDDGPLFASAGWARVMATLGARGWWPAPDAPSAGPPPLFVFKRGPFTVGFLGFPVAAASNPAWTPDVFPERVDLLRCSRTFLDGESAAEPGARRVLLPESVIPDLADWPRRGARRIRKDLAFARRQGVGLFDAEAADAEAIHAIYVETLARHGGERRYPLPYFRALLDLAAASDALSARVARVAGQAGVAGFCIAARDGRRGYYLHGGVQSRFRSSGASDLLLHEAIAWARDRGCSQYSLMPSPVSQAGLARFKQKWGEVDGAWSTTDHVLTARGRLLDLVIRARRRP